VGGVPPIPPCAFQKFWTPPILQALLSRTFGNAIMEIEEVWVLIEVIIFKLPIFEEAS
jgi:hypothetical protein